MPKQVTYDYYQRQTAEARLRRRPKQIAQGRKDFMVLVFFTVLMIMVLAMLEDHPDRDPEPTPARPATIQPAKPLLLW